MLTSFKRNQYGCKKGFLIIVLLTFIFVGCGSDDSSKDSNSNSQSGSQTGSTTKGSEDRWGGPSYDKFISKEIHNMLASTLVEEGYAGQEDDMTRWWSNCVYDKMTEYLERTYGSPKEQGVDYRARVPDKVFEKAKDNCYKEMKRVFRKTR